MPSVLWHCFSGPMKSIWPVNNWVWGVGVVVFLERGADCLHMVQLMPLHPKTPSSLASFKSRLILLFWYRLTRVVLDKGPLNLWLLHCSLMLLLVQSLVTILYSGSYWARVVLICRRRQEILHSLKTCFTVVQKRHHLQALWLFALLQTIINLYVFTAYTANS